MSKHQCEQILNVLNRHHKMIRDDMVVKSKMTNMSFLYIGRKIIDWFSWNIYWGHLRILRINLRKKCKSYVEFNISRERNNVLFNANNLLQAVTESKRRA